MARKSSFADSVINGTYEDDRRKNIQQPIQETQPTINNSFANSVINGTYDSNKSKNTINPTTEVLKPTIVSTEPKTNSNNSMTSFSFSPSDEITPQMRENYRIAKEKNDRELGKYKEDQEDDGYHFGDITKGILKTGGDIVKGTIDLGGKVIGTVADVGGNLIHGGLQALEGGADAIQYLGADINDFFGREKEAELLRKNARFNSVGALFGENKPEENLIQINVLEALDKNSWAPEIIDDISGGVGGVAMNAALAYITGGGSANTIATNTSIFTTSYGNAMSNALNNGASVGDARLTALIDATASTVAENAFDSKFGMKTTGFLGKALNGKIGNAFNNIVKTDKGKALFGILKSAVEEGSEEVIEPMISNFSQSLAHNLISSYDYNRDKYSNNPIEEFFKPLTQRETLEKFVMAALTSAVYNTGANALSNAITNNNTKQEVVMPQNQTKTPQIQTNQENNVNSQPTREQLQIDLNGGNNEVIQSNNENTQADNRAEWTKTREGVIEHVTKMNNMFDGTGKALNEQQKLDLINSALEMGGYAPINSLNETRQQSVDNNKENVNIPETKSEDVLKISNKKTSGRVADSLTKTIEGRNNSQNIKEIVRNIEQETGKKMRSWVETSTTSTGTTELVNSMNKEKITYEPTSNKKNLDNANKELSGMTYEQKLEKAKSIINGDKRLNSTDIAILETVIKEAQESGKINDFIELVQDTAILGTESGQVIQALSLIRQSDPTTQLSTLQKLIEREQIKGNKIYDGVKIKEDLVENVLNSYNEDGTWNQEKFDNAMYVLKQDIVNQMHVRPTEKFTAWRYLSMLGNPKTHIRNVVANIAMGELQRTKNKIATVIETITPMNKLNKLLGGSEEATRGHTFKKSTQEVKNYSNTTVENYFKEHKQTSKYNDKVNSLKSELESERKIFSEKNIAGKALNKLDKANSRALDLEDVVFNKATAKKAFSEFLTANGIETQQDIDSNPEIVAQGLEYALFKGKEATFHQHSTTGTMLRNARESLRQGSNLSRIVGLGMDATMPFINTPINIAKTGIEYTPGLGMIKTISDVHSAPKNLKADVFIDSLSKQFAGGVLAAVGYALAKEGILNGKGGSDKKDKLEKNLGKQDYSVNLFGKTYDLSWLSPSAMPLFVGVETYNATKGNKTISPESMMDLLASTVDPLSEMSVISSVTQALQSYSQGTQALGDIGASALTSYISQYIPTLSSQVATLFDDTQRSSTGSSLGEKIINQAKYKIPGLRNTLPAQVNVWGEEKKYAENPIIRAVEAFISPANRKEVKIDDTTKEIERVYDNTGSGLPSLSLTKTPKIDTESYNLSSEEYTQYKKDYGKNAKDMLDDLMKEKDYKNADDVERSKMISAIYEYATYMARKKIADENNLKFEYKKSKGSGYNYPKYYLSLSKDDFAKYVADKYIDYTEKEEEKQNKKGGNNGNN